MPITTLAEQEERCEQQSYTNHVLIGESEQVSRMRLQISRIAPHFRTVLVTGEGGTGKQAIARELHRLCLGTGRNEPFVVRNIASFAQAPLAINLAGVLLLEGLERLESALQEPLVERLRVIQRQMRIVVSSECEVRSLMATGRLRQNLAARIGGLEIRASPLRDRMDDLAPLVRIMLEQRASRASFSPEALAAMARHDWPGNLAELSQVVAQLAGLDGVVGAEQLPGFARAMPLDHSGARLEHVMQRHVFDVLQRCSGNKLRAAEMLGISRSTLYRMLDAATDPQALL